VLVVQFAGDPISARRYNAAMDERFQFSLRRLLAAMSLCCVGMSDILFWYRRYGSEFSLAMPGAAVWPCAIFSIGAIFGAAAGTIVEIVVVGLMIWVIANFWITL
jgi:hypothetical protein